jgi:hypothetical protein
LEAFGGFYDIYDEVEMEVDTDDTPACVGWGSLTSRDPELAIPHSPEAVLVSQSLVWMDGGCHFAP